MQAWGGLAFAHGRYPCSTASVYPATVVLREEVIVSSEGLQDEGQRGERHQSRCRRTRPVPRWWTTRCSPTRLAGLGHKSAATWVLLPASGYLIVPEVWVKGAVQVGWNQHMNPGDDDRNLTEAVGETTADFGDHFLDELDNGSTAITEAETAERVAERVGAADC